MTVTNLDNSKARTQQQALMRTEQLSLSYGKKIAFEDVSIAINQSKITALVGPSGCGKSSFLSCLNRLTDLIYNCRVTGRIFLP